MVGDRVQTLGRMTLVFALSPICGTVVDVTNAVWVLRRCNQLDVIRSLELAFAVVVVVVGGVYSVRRLFFVMVRCRQID